MDAQTLSALMGDNLSLQRYGELLPAWKKLLTLVVADEPREIAMIAAQIGTETAGMRYQSEIASGEAYEGRADLGNTQPGDGRRFKGQGWIQVTGRHNFTQVSKWAFEQGITRSVDYFLRNPTQLGTDQYCWVGPAWYITTARPTFMRHAANGDVLTCTKLVNGGTNWLEDRRRRYEQAMRILQGGKSMEKVLQYSRDQVTQDTFYNCGPASSQTIIRSKTGRLIGESTLGAELRTHTGGTDYIGQFPAVLNRYMPGAGYKHTDMPNDPPTQSQRDKLWNDIKGSIDGGHGVVANIVAPPSNYPRASYKSTQSPAYGGGTVYHYIAVMGYAVDAAGVKHVWIADSGFRPYGYWMTFNQLATLIPPKGYAYATAKAAPKQTNTGGGTVDKAQADRIEKLLTIIADQLVGYEKDAKGYKFSGWKILGFKTVVDALGEVLALLKEIREMLKKGGK